MPPLLGSRAGFFFQQMKCVVNLLWDSFLQRKFLFLHFLSGVKLGQGLAALVEMGFSGNILDLPWVPIQVFPGMPPERMVACH